MGIPLNRPNSTRTATVCFAGLLVASLLVPPGGAQEDLRLELLPKDPEALSALFAPILVFTGSEPYRPIPAEALLQHADLRRDGVVLVDAPVPPEVLADYDGADVYLDLPDDAPESYASISARYPATVYARVASVSEGLLLQYWFFYLYNDGLNQHEGDWELISLLLESSGRPQLAAYSQHLTGVVRHWTKVERVLSHPIVHIADGSHASYFARDSASLRLTPCGFTGLDSTSDAVSLGPEEYALVLLADQPWLAFGGHWGGVSSLPGGSGPRGPKHRTDGCGASLWDPPPQWFQGLPADRQDSLVPRQSEAPLPQIQVTGPLLKGESLRFSAANSTDDGEVVYAEWNWGDGEIDPGLEVSHAYNVSGTFVVELIVMDDDGLLNSQQLDLNIRDPGDQLGGPLPIGPILSIAAAVVTFLVLLGYVLRRRRSR